MISCHSSSFNSQIVYACCTFTMIKAILFLCSILFCRLSWSLSRPTFSHEFNSGNIRIINSECCIFVNVAYSDAFNNIPSAYLSIPIRLLIWNRCDIFVRNKRAKLKNIVKFSNLSCLEHLFIIFLLSGDIELNPSLTSFLQFGHLNIDSIRNKAPSLQHY